MLLATIKTDSEAAGMAFIAILSVVALASAGISPPKPVLPKQFVANYVAAYNIAGTFFYDELSSVRISLLLQFEI